MATFEQYKKKDGTKAWMFKAYLGKDAVTGKDVRTTRRGFSSKRKAQDELNQLQVDFKRNNNILAGDHITYRETFELWYRTYKESVRDSTLNRTNRIFKNNIFPVFDKQKVKDITPMHCQTFANDLVDKYVTYDQIVYYAGAPLAMANKLDVIDSNPFDKITLPIKKDDKKFTNVLNKEELKALLKISESEKQTHAQIRLIAFSGLRIGESDALNWGDLDFNNNTLDITKTVSRAADGIVTIEPPKTTSSIRKLPMDAETMDIMRRWKFQQEAQFSYFSMKLLPDSEQLVFPSKYNKIENGNHLYNKLNKFCKRAKVNRISPHGLRHTHASLLFESGVSMKEIQERLGHASANFTSDIYTHLSEATQSETINKLSKYLDF